MNWHVIQSFSIKLEHNNWKWKYFHCPTIWSEGKDWQVRPWSPSVIERKDEHQKMFRPTHNTNTRYEDCHWGVIELFNLTSSAPLSLFLSCLSTHAFMNNPALSGAWTSELTEQEYMGSRRLMCQAQGKHGSVSGPPHMWWLLVWCFVGCLTVETGVFLALLGNLSTLPPAGLLYPVSIWELFLVLFHLIMFYLIAVCWRPILFWM